jgi:hypothetical protein
METIDEKIKSGKWICPAFNQTFLVTSRDELVSLPLIVSNIIRNYDYDLFDEYNASLNNTLKHNTEIYNFFANAYKGTRDLSLTLINRDKTYIEGWPETLFVPMMFKWTIHFPFHIIVEYTENVTQPWLPSFERLVILKQEFRGHKMKNFGL